MGRDKITLAILAVMAMTAMAWASPSEDDLAVCEKLHSRATCIHSVMP